jgi:hypothetical protein
MIICVSDDHLWVYERLLTIAARARAEFLLFQKHKPSALHKKSEADHRLTSTDKYLLVPHLDLHEGHGLTRSLCKRYAHKPNVHEDPTAHATCMSFRCRAMSWGILQLGSVDL